LSGEAAQTDQAEGYRERHPAVSELTTTTGDAVIRHIMDTTKVLLVLSLIFFAFVILHVTRAEAQAQPQQVFQVLHNGSLMSLEVLPDHNVVIRYTQRRVSMAS
jgi:hypothetical protein